MPRPKLPEPVRRLTKNYRLTRDTEGMSPARVYQLTGRDETLFLKITDRRFNGTTYDVEREKDMLLWLQNKLPVPQVLHFEEHEGEKFLLMRAARGLAGQADHARHRSTERMIRIYSEAVQRLHAVSLADCPFDSRVERRLTELDHLLRHGLADLDRDHWEDDTPFEDARELYAFLRANPPEEELVFSHGDLGDSNIFIQDNSISGFIDWGRGGAADKWQDIAFCVRSIRHDLGDDPAYLDLFFRLLDVQPDWKRIQYHILLDELF